MALPISSQLKYTENINKGEIVKPWLSLLPIELEVCLRTHPKILIVDDDSDFLAYAKATLDACIPRTSGGVELEVSTAECGKSGLLLLRNVPFDAAVIDLKMRGMDGLELIEQLRGIQPTLPVMLTSGSLTEEITLSAIELGCNDFLEKPQETRDFIHKVVSLIFNPTPLPLRHARKLWRLPRRAA